MKIPPALLLHGGGESGIKFGGLCSLDDKGSSSRGAGGILQIFEIDLRVSVVWIHEESKQLDTWQQFGEHLELLGAKQARDQADCRLCCRPDDCGLRPVRTFPDHSQR
jgi:hypothetical protein